MEFIQKFERGLEPLPSHRAEAIPFVAKSPQPNLQAAFPPLRLWAPILLTGLTAGIAGGLLMHLLRLVQHFCFHYSSGDFLDGVEGTSAARRLLVVATAGIIVGVAQVMIHRIKDHPSRGINESIWKHHGELNEQSLTAKSLLSIVIVGMGAALGREAALKQTGGVLGFRFSQWFGLTPDQQQLLVACGTGAGMAAAYNVPLGGALFILEVLLGTASLAAAVPAFATCFIATLVSWWLLPNAPTYRIPYLPVTQSLMVWSLLSGPVMGLGSVLFVRGLHWAKDHSPRGRAVLFLPVLVFAVLGAASIEWPALLGNGKNVIQLAFDSRVSFDLFAILLLLRPLATMACLRAGAPGGLFTPTMSFGALIGGVCGNAWSYVWPGADKRSCALIGAGAVLAAATQAPVSSLAFTLELTYNTSTLMVPLLLALCGATLTFRCFETRTSY